MKRSPHPRRGGEPNPAGTIKSSDPESMCAKEELAGPRPRRLSEELQCLIEAFAERPVRLREVLEVMHGRGYTMLLILLVFPFSTPIPLPGLSTPFGFIVAFIGLRLALGQKPWLPARLLNTELPAKFFPRLLAATRRLVRCLEFFLRPRLGYVLLWRVTQRGLGAIVLLCGLLLMLPLPIPFTNALPAITVLLLAAAMLEEDSFAAMAGLGVFLLTLAFFAAILWGGAEAVNVLREYFGEAFQPDD